MNYQELKTKSEEIVSESLVLLKSILNEIEMLDIIIKENQISDFIKVWRDCVLNNKGLDANFSDDSFTKEFGFIINRMNAQNKIKERIIELTDSTNSKINSLS